MKPNNNLVCTRIKETSKVKLEFIKAYYSGLKDFKCYSKSDYATLELLIDIEYNIVLDIIK